MSATKLSRSQSSENDLKVFSQIDLEFDPLLSCLSELTCHFGHPRSVEALQAGLPDGGQWISPGLFGRAAERAGLSARLAESPLEKVPAYALPAVLILEDGDACILWQKDEDGKCTIGLPKEPDEVRQVDQQTLAKSYTGALIFVLPRRRTHEVKQHPQRRKDNHWFWSALYLDWWSYAQVALAAVMINLFALASPLFIMNVYDRIVPNRALDSLWVLATGITIVFGFDFILKTLRGYFIDVTGRRVDILLANRIFDQLLDARMEARPASAGSFANTLRELETLRDFFTSATLASLVDLPFIILFIGAFWYIAGPIAVIPLVAVPLVLLLGIVVHFPLSRVVNDSFSEGHQKHGVLIETLGGLETVKSVRGEGRMRHRWMASSASAALAGHRARFLSQLVINITALITQLAYIGIVVYGVYLISAGEISQGTLIACVILSGRTMAPLAQFAALLTRLHHAISSFRALDGIMQKPVERPLEKKFLHRPDLKGGVEFREVDFSYPGNEVVALSKVNFTIQPGEKVAFIGRTGSGKTTIEKMMLGLFAPSQGAVLVDGTDLRQLDPVDLRGGIGCVPQDVCLFHASLRENITMGVPRATDTEVLKVARISGVEDFIATHPMGYDLPVGERGEGLSGGQKQAVAIARALLGEPPLLIMDEPTSSMDNRSEDLFKSRLREILAEHTLILITHRASLLELVDRIIVLDQGKIVADGPKDVIVKDLAAGKVSVAA